MVTTRWNLRGLVTVGYFEVQPYIKLSSLYTNLTAAQKAAIYPDGFTLGGELSPRYRRSRSPSGYYIIDGALPVGFQRSQDLNSSDKAILMDRFIDIGRRRRTHTKAAE